MSIRYLDGRHAHLLTDSDVAAAAAEQAARDAHKALRLTQALAGDQTLDDLADEDRASESSLTRGDLAEWFEWADRAFLLLDFAQKRGRLPADLAKSIREHLGKGELSTWERIMGRAREA